MNQQINGYALALYSIADEKNAWQKFKKTALDLKAVIEQNMTIVTIFNQYDSNEHDKHALVKKMFSRHFPQIWLNFLSIVAYRHKFHLIVPILNKLILLINNHLDIKSGTLYSVVKLTSQEIKQISNRISDLMNVKVELINKIDYSLIGGIKVVVDSEEFDDSLYSRLKKLEIEMINGGESKYGE